MAKVAEVDHDFQPLVRGHLSVATGVSFAGFLKVGEYS
jgi:hypothetical protein